MTRAKKDSRFTERLRGLLRPGENDTEFARRCGVPQSYVWRWLHEGAIPQAEHCAKVAVANRVSTHWLITGRALDIELSENTRDIVELEQHIPRAYHQALSDCIALFNLEHPDRDIIKNQVGILLEHAKRQIKEAKTKEATKRKNEAIRFAERSLPDPSKLVPKDPLAPDNESIGKQIERKLRNDRKKFRKP